MNGLKSVTWINISLLYFIYSRPAACDGPDDIFETRPGQWKVLVFGHDLRQPKLNHNIIIIIILCRRLWWRWSLTKLSQSATTTLKAPEMQSANISFSGATPSTVNNNNIRSIPPPPWLCENLSCLLFLSAPILLSVELLLLLAVVYLDRYDN